LAVVFDSFTISVNNLMPVLSRDDRNETEFQELPMTKPISNKNPKGKGNG